MYWSPNFLSVVFKKQEISQQVVTRMQDLASDFSKKFLEATPSRTQHPARPLAWRGAQAPGVGTQTLVPLNFSAVVASLFSAVER